MQAAVIDRPGGVEVFKLVHDHPKPTRGLGQVMVPAATLQINLGTLQSAAVKAAARSA
jgi:hypothetical protein